jgi:hypothetical protein
LAIPVDAALGRAEAGGGSFGDEFLSAVLAAALDPDQDAEDTPSLLFHQARGQGAAFLLLGPAAFAALFLCYAI